MKNKYKIIFIAIIFCSIIFIYYDMKSDNRYWNNKNFIYNLDKVNIEVTKIYTDRGKVALNDSFSLNTNLEYLNGKSIGFYFSDIALPFTLLKNNDSIFIIKEGGTDTLIVQQWVK